MVQLRTPRQSRFPSTASLAEAPRSARVLPLTAPAPFDEADMPDRLGSMTDREDLERLFARRVPLPLILQLMGRRVSRERIHEILQAANPEEEVRKILG